jgi:hypothetical protein
MRLSPVDNLSCHIPVSHEQNATASQKRLTFKIRDRLGRSSSTLTFISSKLSSLCPSVSGVLRGNVGGGGKGTCCVCLRSLVLVRDPHVLLTPPPPPPPSAPSVLSRNGLVAVAAKGTLNTVVSRWDEGISDNGMGPMSVGRSGGSRSSCCCRRSDRDRCCGRYCNCCCWYCNCCGCGGGGGGGCCWRTVS